MSASAEVATPSTSRVWLARLRVAVPLVFLATVVWLVVREIGSDFDLPQTQRTLIDVPTLPAIGVARSRCPRWRSRVVDVAVARWLGIALRASDLLRLAFVANAMANTLNLAGATGAASG